MCITKTIPVTDKNFLSTVETSCLPLHSFPAWKYGLKFITLEGRKLVVLFLTCSCKILAYSHYLAWLSTKSSSSILHCLYNLVSTRDELLSPKFCFKRLNSMNNKTNSIFIFLMYLCLCSTIPYSIREKICLVVSHSVSQMLLTQLWCRPLTVFQINTVKMTSNLMFSLFDDHQGPFRSLQLQDADSVL